MFSRASRSLRATSRCSADTGDAAEHDHVCGDHRRDGSRGLARLLRGAASSLRRSDRRAASVTMAAGWHRRLKRGGHYSTLCTGLRSDSRCGHPEDSSLCFDRAGMGPCTPTGSVKTIKLSGASPLHGDPRMSELQRHARTSIPNAPARMRFPRGRRRGALPKKAGTAEIGRGDKAGRWR